MRADVATGLGPTELRVPAAHRAIERRLSELSPASCPGDPLTEAMRAALLAPGKRLRPILAMLSCAELGRDGLAALDPACAIEMIHTASLVLDDLPSMDDARTRRGQPATHVAFGENAAILAAISLIGRAFATVAGSARLDASGRARIVAVLGDLIGPDGLSGGQMDDLRGTRLPLAALPRVVDTNHRKTASLFLACVEVGIVVAGASGSRAERLRRSAVELGHAFQLRDDLADAAASAGEDRDKSTLVAMLGRDEALGRMRAHTEAALDGLRPGGELAAFVRAIFSPGGVSATAERRVGQ